MKGMNRIRRGKNFHGVVSYALSPAPHHSTPPVLIGGNLVGITVEELTAEFAKTQQLRKDVEKAVWHNSLRLPKGDSLTNEHWKLIADDYMKRMGFSDTHLRCYVLHDDEVGQHIHIIASRINILNGQLYLGRNENLKSTRIIQELEKDHQLTRTKGPSPSKPPQKHKKLTRNEEMMEVRTGEKASKRVIQEAIDAVLVFFNEITIEDFINALQKQSITAIANIASTGKMNGFSFEYGGFTFKASQLGKAYGWSNLSNRIVSSPLQAESVLNVTVADNESLVSSTEVQHSINLPSYSSNSNEHSIPRWLQWIPYLNELVSHLKTIGSTILKPIKGKVTIHVIHTVSPESREILEESSKSLAEKHLFKVA
ncbi:relaxase/mobilization nuclease domain-containing protein [Pantoea agglomerans]|uniref:Relaxase/Mobilisation nuclease domain n=1 Tax=Enterobacter agglomerans TaxID=549 RepID=A0A379AKB0_ENTAG|nr:relaxase/mobilization nuclease domain-containing protein [Pantoea agglomerans]QXB58166.1 relaxase/mobilization nuclease domain-containing protein [Pantoea agglomerans]SUB17982.1 Relaxase/Mobilisation nuclease domain [Pantoea agglomerans]